MSGAGVMPVGGYMPMASIGPMPIGSIAPIMPMAMPAALVAKPVVPRPLSRGGSW